MTDIKKIGCLVTLEHEKGHGNEFSGFPYYLPYISYRVLQTPKPRNVNKHRKRKAQETPTIYP